MELVVNVEVWHADVINGIEEAWKEDEDFQSGELKHRSEHNDKVCTDFNHSPKSTVHVFKNVDVSVENLQDFANWCHIKEKINGCIQDFLECMPANFLANFLVATVNNVIFDHVK